MALTRTARTRKFGTGSSSSTVAVFCMVQHGTLIDVNEHFVVLLGRVLGLILATSVLSYDVHLVLVSPGPCDLTCEIFRIAGGEVQSRLVIRHDLCHCSNSGGDYRHAKCESLDGNQAKGFIIPL